MSICRTRTRRRAAVVLLVGSLSFVGIGMVAAILPLLFPERGAEMTFVISGILLLVSGVYYPVSVLPGWMQPLATVSPATYVLRGMRDAILDGHGITHARRDAPAAPADRRRLHPARHVGLRHRRAIRQADGQVEAERVGEPHPPAPSPLLKQRRGGAMYRNVEVYSHAIYSDEMRTDLAVRDETRSFSCTLFRH